MAGTRTETPAPRRHPFALGLRARVTLAFGLGALALSVLLALMTYGAVSRYLLLQRSEAAYRQTTVAARNVQDALLTSRPALPDLLTTLHPGGRGDSVLYYRGSWYSTSLDLGASTIPPELLGVVQSGRPASQRVALPGGTRLVVGMPLPRAHAAYFEVFPLAELDRALRSVGLALAAAAVVTTLLGMVVGRWASSRALRPLTGVTGAAARVAAGHLDTRLDVGRDPDLAVLAASFNATAAALQRRVESDARFAANVSHELRSPLTTMVNAVELLEARRHELSADAREALDLLAYDVRRFDRMVRELLELARAHDGRPDLVLEEVRLADLVRHAADATAGRPVTRVCPGAETLRVDADKRRLERVVVNLVENAQVHGGGIDRVLVEPADGGVRCAVEDRGPGVPHEHRDRVFGRFVRGPAARNGDAGAGVGLGLALSAEHVRLHGGRLWVEDRADGPGARFVMELPVLR